MESTEQTKLTEAPAAVNADDMLSQLAGDDIDRLLAEAENGASPPMAPAGEPVDPVPEATPDVAAPAADLPASGQDKENEINEPQVAAPAEAGVTAPESSSAPASVLDIASAPESFPATPRGTTSAPAVEGLPAKDPKEEPAPAILPVVENEVGALPWHIRVIDMCTAPFEAIPDEVRDGIGIVAVVTLVNALGLMGYMAYHRHRLSKIMPPAATAPHVSEQSDRSSARSASDGRSQKPGS